jgi:Lhr-like helicase
LCAAQLEALPLILDGREDVVITASGKTEAAFLPLLTCLKRVL